MLRRGSQRCLPPQHSCRLSTLGWPPRASQAASLLCTLSLASPPARRRRMLPPLLPHCRRRRHSSRWMPCSPECSSCLLLQWQLSSCFALHWSCWPSSRQSASSSAARTECSAASRHAHALAVYRCRTKRHRASCRPLFCEPAAYEPCSRRAAVLGNACECFAVTLSLLCPRDFTPPSRFVRARRAGRSFRFPTCEPPSPAFFHCRKHIGCSVRRHARAALVATALRGAAVPMCKRRSCSEGCARCRHAARCKLDAVVERRAAAELLPRAAVPGVRHAGDNEVV